MSYAVKAYVAPLETVNSYPVWLNEPVVIPTLSTEKSVSKEISVGPWDTRYWRAVSANLYVKAVQPYPWGATVLFRMNDRDVKQLSWLSGLTGLREDTVDVTSYLSNGVNRFLCRYNVAYTALSDQRCEVTSTLQVTLQYIGPPGEEEQHPPPQPGEPVVWPSWWWIAALGAGVGVIAIAGVIAYQEQQKFQMMMLMLGRRREKE